MRGGIILAVIVTAVVTATATSLFWFVAFNTGAAAVSERPKASAPAPIAPAARAGPLAMPVPGVRPDQLFDTFSQARAAGVRLHDAIDIAAPAGTPVLAAAAGTIEKLFVSDAGGNTIYVRTPDGGWVHYYAHLQGYAPGLREGQPIKAGEVIGAVGATGNADPAAPHLHFAVHRMAPGEQWHQGMPVNPYPLLARR